MNNLKLNKNEYFFIFYFSCAKSSEYEYFTPLFDIIAIIFLNILSNISIEHSNYNFLNLIKKSMPLLYCQVKKYKGPKKIF